MICYVDMEHEKSLQDGQKRLEHQAHGMDVKQRLEETSGDECIVQRSSTDVCRIQAIKRIGRPVYGAQFHPEAYIVEPADRRSWLIDLVYPKGYNERQPDGRRLLINFFRAAGVRE